MNNVIINEIEGYIIIDNVKIYRQDILNHLDYHLHYAGYVSKDQLQSLGNLIISDLLNQTTDENN